MPEKLFLIIIGLLINGEDADLQEEIEPKENSPLELHKDIQTHTLRNFIKKNKRKIANFELCATEKKCEV
jgi:hypothetical protein